MQPRTATVRVLMIRSLGDMAKGMEYELPSYFAYRLVKHGYARVVGPAETAAYQGGPENAMKLPAKLRRRLDALNAERDQHT